MDVLMPQLGETVAEEQDHKMVRIGRRGGEAGRQSVRGRDRQGFDGSAVDPRPAYFGPEIRVAAGEVAPVGAVVALVIADGSGARGAIAPEAQTGAAPPAAQGEAPAGGCARDGSASRSSALAPRSSSTPSSEVRTPRTQFRAGPAAGRRHRDAVGAPARRRSGIDL